MDSVSGQEIDLHRPPQRIHITHTQQPAFRRSVVRVQVIRYRPSWPFVSPAVRHLRYVAGVSFRLHHKPAILLFFRYARSAAHIAITGLVRLQPHNRSAFINFHIVWRFRSICCWTVLLHRSARSHRERAIRCIRLPPERNYHFYSWKKKWAQPKHIEILKCYSRINMIWIITSYQLVNRYITSALSAGITSWFEYALAGGPSTPTKANSVRLPHQTTKS